MAKGLRAVAASLWCLALVFAQSLAPAHSRGGDKEVDVELVLAVDISFSMDLDEQRLQREGYIQALTSPEVIKAIRGGMVGRIAVTYFEWAGANAQRVVVPWQIIDGPEAAQSFATKLAEAPISRWRWTSVSGAILYGMDLFENNGFDAPRRVLDVSGDGPNNNGIPVLQARERALKSGIVINGLPIMVNNGRRSPFDMQDLDDYYSDCVIGGPGAFMISITERDQFVSATRTKILREISGLPGELRLPGGVRILRANTEDDGSRKKMDCMIGERQWQERFRN
jgi:hypothetical protein